MTLKPATVLARAFELRKTSSKKKFWNSESEIISTSEPISKMGSMSKKRQRDSLKDDGLNDHITPKRKRTYTEQDQKLAKIYDQLADERKEIRIQAAKDLVTEFSAEKEPSGEFIEKNLARLIKGLCSSRKHARFGFSVALSELLRQFYCQGKSLEGVPDLGKLIEKFEELTVAHGDVAGQVSCGSFLSIILSSESKKYTLLHYFNCSSLYFVSPLIILRNEGTTYLDESLHIKLFSNPQHY